MLYLITEICRHFEIFYKTNMSKTTKTQKKPDEKSKSNNYVWTDDEVELLLKVANKYKVSKTTENIDWESCQSKYSDIHKRLLDQLKIMQRLSTQERRTY